MRRPAPLPGNELAQPWYCDSRFSRLNRLRPRCKGGMAKAGNFHRSGGVNRQYESHTDISVAIAGHWFALDSVAPSTGFISLPWCQTYGCQPTGRGRGCDLLGLGLRNGSPGRLVSWLFLELAGEDSGSALGAAASIRARFQFGPLRHPGAAGATKRWPDFVRGFGSSGAVYCVLAAGDENYALSLHVAVSAGRRGA